MREEKQYVIPKPMINKKESESLIALTEKYKKMTKTSDQCTMNKRDKEIGFNKLYQQPFVSESIAESLQILKMGFVSLSVLG